MLSFYFYFKVILVMNEPFEYTWVGNLERKMPNDSILYVAYFVSDAYYFAVEWADSLEELEDKIYYFMDEYHRDLSAMKVTKNKHGSCTEEFLPGYTAYSYMRSHPKPKVIEPEPFI